MSVLTRRHRFTNPRATNFYYSFVFLPREKREAIEAVYAFARRGDDVADGDLAPLDATREIERYRKALDACYADPTRDDRPGEANLAADSSLRALSEAVRRYKIPRQYFEDLILGLEMDLRMDRGGVRYQTFDELAVYCYRVAGAIGLIAIEIFGYRNPQAREYAVSLGQALQLVNILRDVQSDARRGHASHRGTSLHSSAAGPLRRRLDARQLVHRLAHSRRRARRLVASLRSGRDDS